MAPTPERRCHGGFTGTSLVGAGLRCLWAIALAALVVASAGTRPASAETQAPAAPEPPALDIQITPTHHSLERLEKVVLYVVVTNKSSTDVINLRAALKNDDFSGDELPTFPPLLKAFSSDEGSATISPKSSAGFIEQQVLFIFDYDWSLNGNPVHSAQGSAVTFQVVRRFSEETQGILGGSAALLYLLLPIIPLALGFQIVNHVAVTGRPELPSFNTDYVLPAFLFAVLLNLVLFVPFRIQPDYSDPATMVGILTGSFLLGGAIAGVRHWRPLDLLLNWTYRDSDSSVRYLEKALLRPDAAQVYQWVTGTDREGNAWSGIRLQQSVTDDPVLGATFQATRSGEKPTGEELKQNVFTEDGSVRSDRRSRNRLIQLLKAKTLTLTPVARVQQGSGAEGRKDTPVVTGLAELKETNRERRPLVTLT